MSDDDRVHPQTREEWRDWLAANHATSTGVWLVTWRKASGHPALDYGEAVEEALRVGWVDSKAKGLDEARSMRWYSPRKRGSGWSRPNKERIARLEADGLMLPAGQALLDAARADGSWEKLDAVEDLLVPDDLAAALAQRPPAREQFDGFPRSARRAILEWIVLAKRPETRQRRIEQTATLAQQGQRANEWRPPALR